MNENIKNMLDNRNQRIIDAVIKKSENVCPGSVALIGICGSFSTGDIYEKSDLDLLIVVNDDAGWKIASCFILGDVAHDIYCRPWSSLEDMAEYKQPFISKLISSKIVYSADEKYLKRYEELHQKVLQKLNSHFAPEDINKAEGFYNSAVKEYADVMIGENAGECRYASAKMLCQIESAMFMLNKTYVKRGIKRIPEEIQAMKKLPARFIEYYTDIVRAETVSAIQNNCTALIRSVKELLAEEKKKFRSKNKLTSENLNGTYEEIFSNWKNKMAHAADCNDAYLSLMTAASCQGFYDERADEYEMEPLNLMKDFSPNDLAASAKAFDQAMSEYKKEYDKINKPVRYYASLEDFEKDYLK